MNEQNLLYETRVILSLIYQNYICTLEKKKQLIERDKEELKKEEQILHEKYKIDFQKRNDKIQNSSHQQNNKYMVKVLEEKWYKRIINKILQIFSR